MNLKPLQDWAVIRRSEAEEKTAGGIIIPDTAKEKPLEGVIVSIGPGRFKLEKGKEKEKKKKFVPTVLKPGQKVIYQRYAEREVELGSEVITLVREEDILGTVEDYAVADRKTHALQEKREGSVAIREKAHVPAVTPPGVSEEKPSGAAKKTAAKKPAAGKATAKTAIKGKSAGKKAAASEKVTSKKPVKKPVTKKAADKSEKKAAKKSAPAKKSVTAGKTVKKAVVKKTAAKKAVPKKAARPAPKKPAARKASVGKAAGKTRPKGLKK